MKKSVAIFALLCILFVFQSALAAEPKKPIDAPTPKTDLVYNGEIQELYVTIPNKSNTYFRWPYRPDGNKAWTNATDEVPRAQYPGKYTVEWIISSTKPAEDIKETYADDITIGEYNPPKPREGLVYNGTEQYLVDLNSGVAKEKDRYWYRNLYNHDQWDSEQKPSATKPGDYLVEYKLAPWNAELGPDTHADGKFTVTISQGTVPYIDPDSQSQPGSGGGRPIYYIGDGTTLFGSGNTLPATGFPTRIQVPLSVKPANINYETLSMRIQIPAINVDVELTGVPEVDGTWAVEWLANQAGLLSGSAMPGEGYAMIAAHNHLNTMEIGPFAMLFSLEENDRIFVNTADDGLQIYSVYANELLEPDDMQKMASIAQSEENSIILVTCENEMVEGGYMNRRAVFAKPQ